MLQKQKKCEGTTCNASLIRPATLAILDRTDRTRIFAKYTTTTQENIPSALTLEKYIE